MLDATLTIPKCVTECDISIAHASTQPGEERLCVLQNVSGDILPPWAVTLIVIAIGAILLAIALIVLCLIGEFDDIQGTLYQKINENDALINNAS